MQGIEKYLAERLVDKLLTMRYNRNQRGIAKAAPQIEAEQLPGHRAGAVGPIPLVVIRPYACLLYTSISMPIAPFYVLIPHSMHEGGVLLMENAPPCCACCLLYTSCRAGCCERAVSPALSSSYRPPTQTPRHPAYSSGQLHAMYW